jgi:hypothetical protein
MPNLAERFHFVNATAPVDINGGAVNSDIWSMENYGHATIIVGLGVTGAASTVTVEECDNFTPDNSTAIAFDVYKEETAAGDTLGARVATAAAGFATSTNDGVFYVIEIDSDQLTAGRPCLRVALSDPSAATLAFVFVILSDPRYPGDQSATAIA